MWFVAVGTILIGIVGMNDSNNLRGFDAFPHTDIILGCQQYIDNLISKRGIDATESIDKIILLDHERRSLQKELDDTLAESNSLSRQIGELMKGGWVITQGKKDPSPHFHPNEEQYMLILEGKINLTRHNCCCCLASPFKWNMN